MASDLRYRHDESLRLQAARLHDAGVGRRAIGAKLGVPHEAVRRCLEKYGAGETELLLKMDWLHFPGQFREGRKSQEEPMADPEHPRHFTDEFKRQVAELVNAGKPKAEVMREYDLSKSTVDRWAKSIDATGSPHAAGNRTPEQSRVIELERENRRLRMEVDVLKQAALTFARK